MPVGRGGGVDSADEGEGEGGSGLTVGNLDIAYGEAGEAPAIETPVADVAEGWVFSG